jgi:ABC-type maltose transport system permease subunit
MSRPVIALALLLAFILSWNELMMSSILSTVSTRPVTPALPAFVTQGITQWGKFAFVALLSLLPVFICIALVLRAGSRLSPAFLTNSKE